jgi:hypothetical protein
MFDATGVDQGLHYAIVSGPDGIHFAASGPDENKMFAGLVRYIQQRCGFTLWPRDAGTVMTLLDAGRIADAIELYFDRVGDRWDREYLELVSPTKATPTVG